MEFFDHVPISRRQGWPPDVESFLPIEAAGSRRFTSDIETRP